MFGFMLRKEGVLARILNPKKVDFERKSDNFC